MKTKTPTLQFLAMLASALIWCNWNLYAQSAPTIAIQPASQTNLVGSNVTFAVAVNGAGPFAYQWQFDGANLPNNIIETFAGNGNAGFTGDGGAATNAALFGPNGVALDASGSLFIADSSNNCIRKVDANGIITIVAGNGIATFSGGGSAATNASLNYPSGVAFDAAGNQYIADQYNHRIEFKQEVQKRGRKGENIITSTS
jgi:hypothetical protein